MKTIQLISASLLFLFILFSCEKDESTPKKLDYIKISSWLNSMFFDKGSYWVYENSDKSKTDSVVIKDVIKDTLELGPSMSGQGITGYAEYYSLEYNSSQLGKYYEQLVGYIISQGCVYGGYLYLSSHNVGDSSCNAAISAIHDSMKIGNLYFRNVVEMHVLADDYVSKEMRLFYVDSVGIVKKEIYSGTEVFQTWNIKQYKVKLYDVQ